MMSTDKIQHLHWRAGFGLSPREYRERSDWSIDKAWDQLLKEARRGPSLARPELPIQEFEQMDREAFLRNRVRNVRQLGADWIRRMGDPDEPALLERMSLFWHGHFACRARSEVLAVNQLNVIRAHALGNFRDLLLGITKDPAMIRYLNNQQNRKQQPNENFARELMELFTLGRGRYTEKDIKEAARAFTGWSSNFRGEFVFRAGWHDYGPKTVFGKKGDFNGEDIVDLILERRETADFLVRKIYRYFVQPEIQEEQVEELTRLFYRSDYDIGRLMEAIFTADWFYAPEVRGARIKSPVELLAGLTRQLEVEWGDTFTLFLLQRGLGQELFNPPNVAGWPQGRAWIDNSTLMTRLSIPALLFQRAEADLRVRFGPEERQIETGKQRLNGSFSLKSLQELVAADRDQQLENLQQLLLVRSPSIPRQKLNEGLREGAADLLSQQCLRLLSLPEYQMC